MTEEEGLKAHERKEELVQAIHDLVDLHLTGLTEEVETQIRNQLSEQVRFWR